MSPDAINEPGIVTETLTPREMDTLQLLAEGLTDREIAERLFVALSTVKWNNRQIYGKLGVNSREQAVERAKSLHWLEAAEDADAAYLNNPYKGLRAFSETDATDFFGREDLTEHLVSRLNDDSPFSRFLAVVGPSGCGKSSLVRAGLVPALRQDALPDSGQWPVVQIVPGSHPLEELDIGLSRITGDPTNRFLADLRLDPRGLLRAARKVLPDGSQLCLIIDQFEEIFTLITSENETRFLLDSLYAAVTDPQSPIYLVIALRADFYDRPLMYPDFSEMVSQRTLAVTPMTPAALNRAITRPAENAGALLEEGLTSALISDITDRPGALPMLQYALTELFDQRQGRTLTLKAYEEIGGTLGALARHTERVYAGLQPDEQKSAQQMLLRLVTLGEGTEDVRRRALVSELLGVGGESAPKVMALFDVSRLLTFDHDPVSGEPTAELAHEAIIREWGSLRAWLDESRDDVRQQRLLSLAANEWRKADHDPSFLLHGSRLARFQDWASTSLIALTSDESALLEASVAEEKRRHDRQRLIRRLAYITTLLVAILMTILAVTASNERWTAQREAVLNRSLVLAASAEDAYASGQTDLSLLLALEAVSSEPQPPEAERVLASILLGPGTRAVLTGHSHGVKAVDFAPNGQSILSGSCSDLDQDDTCKAGELLLWDVSSSAPETRMVLKIQAHADWVNAVAFSPDGHTAVSASGDGTLLLWDVDETSPSFGEYVRRFEGHTAGVNSVAFSPDGEKIVSGAADQTILLWDVQTGSQLRAFTGHTGGINQVVFSPDGQTILSGAEDSTIRLWDTESGQALRRFSGHLAGVRSVAFDAANNNILSTAWDLSLRVWDSSSGEEIGYISLENNSPVLTLQPDGRTAVVAAGSDLALWNLDQLQLQRVLRDAVRVGSSATDTHVWSYAVSKDGERAVSGLANGTLRLWNMETSVERRLFTLKNTSLFGVEVSSDGTYLVTGTLGGDTILWNSASGQEIQRFSSLTGLCFPTFGPNSKHLLVACGDVLGGTTSRSLSLWDVETGEKIYDLEGHEFYPRSAAFSPDGSWLLSGSQQVGPAWPTEGGGDLVLWDLETGQIVRRLNTSGDVSGIAISADGKRALTTSANLPDVTLWNLETGDTIREFKYVGGTTFDVLFGPGESTVLAATADSNVIQWDAETGEVLRRFQGHDAKVWSIDINPDGTKLISGDGKGIVILWDLHTGEELARFRGHRAGIWNVVFSTDGQSAFSSSWDGTVREWQIANRSLTQLLEWAHNNRYIRDFTCEERDTYRIEPHCN